MQDSAEFFAPRATQPRDFTVAEGFILTTLHRAENTDNPQRLEAIVRALNHLHNNVAPVVLTLHPRTRKVIAEQGLELAVYLIDTVGYLEMICLLQRTALVLTDSAGVQKEAFFFGKARVTMRDQTEWIELNDVGANELVGANTDKIIQAATRNLGRSINDEFNLFGGGLAAKRIAEQLTKLDPLIK